jgi:hypothetical protein
VCDERKSSSERSETEKAFIYVIKFKGENQYDGK